MKSRFAFLVLLALAASLQAGVVDLAPQRGKTLAPISWVDETGRTRAMSELSGYPVVLLPIYTRCRGACVQDVARLKEALTASAADVREYRVLLFSFDASDTPAVLATYCERERIPLGWSIGTASQTAIDALLDSIGVQVGKAGTEFTHPNMLIFADSKLRVRKWIYGTDYSGREVDAALQAARGQGDWIGQHSDYLYAVCVFTAVLLCVALVQQLSSYRAAHSRALPVAASGD